MIDFSVYMQNEVSWAVLLTMAVFVGMVIGVSYYRRQAEWRYILRLLPMAVAGFFLALFVDRLIPAAAFKHLMGACLALVLAVMLFGQWRGRWGNVAESKWFSALFGLLGGFTTMIGNAAGPVMAVYLLSTRMPKLAFVGTNAWFFLCVNFLKLPLQLLAWNNINLTTLAIDACAIPFVLVGAFIGIRIVRFLPERGFRIFTTVVTILSVLAMMWL